MEDSVVTVYNVARGTKYVFAGKAGIEAMFLGLFKDIAQSGSRRNQVLYPYRSSTTEWHNDGTTGTHLSSHLSSHDLS